MSIVLQASTPEMDRIFSDENEVQAWLDVEGALARAQARLGVIPTLAAEEISAKAHVEHLDLEALRAEIAGTVHPIVPVVRALSAACSDGHGEYVHWGATSQDILDTGLVLRLRQADEILVDDLGILVEAFRGRAIEHRDTVMAGRTHGQQAVPITLGYKLAVWVDELARHRQALLALRREVRTGQFGCAAGTMSSLGPIGLDIRGELMGELDLEEPAITWHVARDRLVRYAFQLTLIASSLHRFGCELVTLQRDELGEVFEPFHAGKVGSSTMPHKRNPALSETLMTLGELTKNDLRGGLSSLGSLHERDTGIRGVENDYLPRITRRTHRMIRLATSVVEGLEVDRERMHAHLEASQGRLYSENVMMALAGRVGRQRAHEVVYDVAMGAFESGEDLRTALGADPRIREEFSDEDLDALFDVGQLTTTAGLMVDHVCGS